LLSYNELGRFGRLGNQMFQYAALFGIAKRRGLEFCIPPSNGKDVWGEHQLLDAFLLPQLRVVGSQRGARRVSERSFAYDAALAEGCADNVDLHGYFQTEKYFEPVKDEIRLEFQFKPDVVAQCREIATGFAKPPISLHVRRTDFLKFADNHPPCSVEYYDEALKRLPNDLSVIVFSDDIGWCRQQSLFSGPRWNFSENRSNIVDMCLMAHCDHHISANSSFSWWGAWLGGNEKKIVVAPKRWFGKTGYAAAHDISGLLPESWIKI
jgi:hypothetical protein